jgi:hypothetical protein
MIDQPIPATYFDQLSENPGFTELTSKGSPFPIWTENVWVDGSDIDAAISKPRSMAAGNTKPSL